MNKEVKKNYFGNTEEAKNNRAEFCKAHVGSAIESSNADCVNKFCSEESDRRSIRAAIGVFLPAPDVLDWDCFPIDILLDCEKAKEYVSLANKDYAIISRRETLVNDAMHYLTKTYEDFWGTVEIHGEAIHTYALFYANALALYHVAEEESA